VWSSAHFYRQSLVSCYYEKTSMVIQFVPNYDAYFKIIILIQVASVTETCFLLIYELLLSFIDFKLLMI
jgi:hypothetical protein